MASALVVVITGAPEGAFGPRQSVAGMTTVLRLALTAQSAGARAVHLASEAAEYADSLRDPRLKIDVRTDGPDDDAIVIEVAAHVVVHRGLFAGLRGAVADGRARSIGSDGSLVFARPPSVDRASGGPPVPFLFAPPFGFGPIAVTTRADAHRAVSALLRSLRKTQDGWTSTYMNRYVSLSVTRLLVHTGIAPNVFSVAILFIGLASGVVAARGTHDALIVGAALLHTQSILDGCDGELSRLTFRGSRLGEWLDTIGDDLSNYGFFAGASWGLGRAVMVPASGWTFSWIPPVVYLVVGTIIVSCGVLTSGLEYRYLAKIGSGDLLKYPLGLADEGGAPTTLMGKLAAGVRPLFKRDTFVFLTFLAAAAGLLGPMLVIFAVGAIGIFSAVVKAELRMAGERAREAK